MTAVPVGTVAMLSIIRQHTAITDAHREGRARTYSSSLSYVASAGRSPSQSVLQACHLQDDK